MPEAWWPSRPRTVRKVSNAGFDLHRLSSLRETFKKAERSSCPRAQAFHTTSTTAQGPVQFLAFADADSRLVCGLTNGAICIYGEAGQGEAMQVAPPSPNALLTGLIPNPGDRSDLCLAIYAASPEASKGGTCHVLDVRNGQWLATLPESLVTSAAWSNKGKQLVLGLRSGELVQLTPEGEVKARLAPPPEVERPLYVEDVCWLENHVFIVTYNTVADELVHEYDVFAVLRDAKSQSCTYAAFPLDVAPPFGDVDRAGKRYVAALRAWDKEKHLVFMASAPSTDVGVLGCKMDVSGPSAWNALELEDTSRPVLPFSSVDESSDTAPIGLGFDFTATEPVEDPNAAAKGEDASARLPAVPILMTYTNDGVLIAYNVINTDAKEPYPGMMPEGAPKAQPTPPSSSSASAVPTSGSAAPAPAQNSASGSSAAPAFGSTSTPTSSAPAFGSTSAFGSSKPSFGTTSNPGASAFGKPAFGQSAASSGFGAFGGGKSAFGSTASAFGGNAGSDAKGAPAFGSTSTPSAFGGASTAPAFGSTSTPSAFASAASSSSFGKPAFGQTSAFGSHANKPSAFGSTSTGSAFGSTSSQPSFGQTSAFSNAPAFGTPASSSATPGASAFSSLAGKSSGFGGVNSSSNGSIFGSGGSFDKGKPAFEGAKAPPKKEPEPVMDTETPDETSKNTFSFGSMNELMGNKPEKEGSQSTPSVLNQNVGFGSAASTDKSSSGFSFGQKKDNAETVQNKAPTFSFGAPKDSAEAHPVKQDEKQTVSTPSFAKPQESVAKSEESASINESKQKSADATNDSSINQRDSSGKLEDDSTFSFDKNEEKPKDEIKKPDSSAGFSFAKPVEKKDEDESQAKISSPKPIEKGQIGVGKPHGASAFSFAKPDQKVDEIKASGQGSPFSFGPPAKPAKPVEHTSAASSSGHAEQSKENSALSVQSEEQFKDPADTEQAKSTSAGPKTPPGSNDKEASTFSFAKNDEKPKAADNDHTPAFSFARPEKPKSDDKASSTSAFSFAKKDQSEIGSNTDTKAGFSFAKPEKASDGATKAPAAFSFTQPEKLDKDKTQPTPGFSFAKPDAKTSESAASTRPTSGFSFGQSTGPTQQSDSGKQAPSFSIAKPDSAAEKPKEPPAFTFAKPPDKSSGDQTLPSTPGFSLAKPDVSQEAKQKVPAAFSFAPSNEAKKDEKPKSTSALSFAKAEEKSETKQPMPSGFTFAKSAEGAKSQPAFSFAKIEKPKEPEAPKKTPFSFTKPSETSNEAPAAAPSENHAQNKETPKAPAFSFAKSEASPSPAPAFSLAKPSGQGFSFAPAQQTKATEPEPPKEAPVSRMNLSDVQVPSLSLPSLPPPSVTEEGGELQREFVKIYLSVNGELEALRKKADENSGFYRQLQASSGSPKCVDDLQDAKGWTFGDMNSIAAIAEQLQTDIDKADRVMSDCQQQVTGIQSMQLKAEIKRDETSRFLRARKDPSFAKLVHVRHLGPEHMENQQRLRRTTHMVRERMQELEDYLHTIKTAVANDKQGRTAMQAPSLDSVYRSAEHISTLAARRLGELERLSAELRELRPSASPEKVYGSESMSMTPRKTSTALDSVHALQSTLPEVTSDIDREAEEKAQYAALDSLFKARQTPLVTKASTAGSGTDASSTRVPSPVVLKSARARQTMEPKPAPETEEAPSGPKEPAPEPTRPDFLATKTPSGTHFPSASPQPPARKPFQASTMGQAGGSPSWAAQGSVPSQYTTFEGLVPPRRASPAKELTLEQFVAQEDNDGYDEEDDDYGEDEDEDDEDDDYDEDSYDEEDAE